MKAVASASAWFSGKTTIEGKILAELSSFKELVAAFDVYLKEHQARNVSYTKFVSAGLRSSRYPADSLKKRALN